MKFSKAIEGMILQEFFGEKKARAQSRHTVTVSTN